MTAQVHRPPGQQQLWPVGAVVDEGHEHGGVAGVGETAERESGAEANARTSGEQGRRRPIRSARVSPRATVRRRRSATPTGRGSLLPAGAEAGRSLRHSPATTAPSRSRCQLLQHGGKASGLQLRQHLARATPRRAPRPPSTRRAASAEVRRRDSSNDAQSLSRLRPDRPLTFRLSRRAAFTPSPTEAPRDPPDLDAAPALGVASSAPG